MGFRFQKRMKVLPGVTINLSKSGVTTSLGTRGARVTLGRGQTRKTVGLPGSGLSHTTVSKSNAGESQLGVWVGIAIVIGLVALVALAR